MEAFQRNKTIDVRATRDQAATDAALDALRKVATDGGNVMDAILAAVKTYATLGEIIGVMKEEFGIYREENWI